jgi:hypothetical protein
MKLIQRIIQKLTNPQKMRTLTLERFLFTEKSTISRLSENDNFICYMLELPWKNNQRQISSIPTGTYDVIPRTSPRYKNHFHLLNVPNRLFILIHVGNYPKDTNGCLLPGTSHTRDMVGSSRVAMENLLSKYPKGFKLIVK